MSNTIITAAEIVRNKYKFEIDGCLDANEFFKCKFVNDRKFRKVIRIAIYKKSKV
jgi:hypothetical protein